jgi:SAM-dependent methyltransferase
VGTELDVFATAVGWKSYVRDTLQPYIGGAILEVGAGKGSFTISLSKLDCTEWVCLEPDSALADEIRQRRAANELPPYVNLVVGTEADLPKEQVFDTILYLDVLEHISDDEAEVRRAARRLAIGGRLIILSPAFPMLYSKFDAAIGHYRRYTRKSLERLRPADIVAEAAFYLDAPGALLSLANRLLLRSAQPTLNQIAFWDRVMVPLARKLDPIVGRCVGRSVVVVWRKQLATFNKRDFSDGMDRDAE